MGGTNGVEIAKQLREFDKDCMIAFSTTSTDYTLWRVSGYGRRSIFCKAVYPKGH